MNYRINTEVVCIRKTPDEANKERGVYTTLALARWALTVSVRNQMKNYRSATASALAKAVKTRDAALEVESAPDAGPAPHLPLTRSTVIRRPDADALLDLKDAPAELRRERK